MNNRISTILLAGIFVALAMIAFKPAPTLSVPPQTIETYPLGDQVVQLNDNTIAIIDTDDFSSANGKILILRYDEQENTVTPVTTYNYLSGE